MSMSKQKSIDIMIFEQLQQFRQRIDLLRESAREGTEQLYVDNGSNEVES
jgi:hypothetical protein